MFRGTFTALVTPFRDGAVDGAAYEKLIEWQIENGVSGVVPVGTTGESPTLDQAEHTRVIEIAVRTARGRVPVIAGTGSNSTAEAVALTQDAEKVGADAALLVAPYYNKPSQEGLFRHFKAIADATKLPLILYSIPGRCGIEIGVETVRRLAAACANVVALKESGGSVERVNALRAVLPEQFDILSGDDFITLAFLVAGARGVISVASNLVPRQVAEMVSAFLDGKIEVAQRAHARLYPLFRDLFIEPNPVPVKAALAWAGRIAPEVRLPLCEMSEANAEKLRATLRSLDLAS